MFQLVKPLSKDKISDVTKLKKFADDKLKADGVENTVGKGENAGYMLVISIFSFSYGVF